MPLSLAFILSVVLTVAVRKAALRYKILDYPGGDRKIHQKPIPLLGGLAIFLSFFIIVLYYAFFTDNILDGIRLKNLIGVLIASAVIMIGGFLDDKYNLKPKYQIIWPILAVIIVIAGGLGVTDITNPFGGVFELDQWKFVLFWYQGTPAQVFILADVFTMVWLLGLMYTTKFLDGLDGLTTGVSAIAALIIFFLANTEKFFQPPMAYLAIIFFGAGLGFLIFNFHPAKIFLGEGGSLWTGFMLGVLSIIAGSKVMTTILVMGIPILDVVWVVARRTFWEKKLPTKADKKHFHYRLLDVGLSHRQAVLSLYVIALVFGLLTLFLPSLWKLIAWLILIVLMVISGSFVVVRYKKILKP